MKAEAEQFNRDDWVHPTLVPYFDVNEDVIERSALALSKLNVTDKATALDAVAKTVRRTVANLQDTAVAKTAVTIVDHLYRMMGLIHELRPETSEYIKAAHGTYFDELAKRGYCMRYVVENYIDGTLDRATTVFWLAFSAAGFVYACPEYIANELAVELGIWPRGQQIQASDLAPLRDKAHEFANEVAAKATAARRHLFYFLADYEEGDLDTVMHKLPTPEGTIVVFRNEAPLPHSDIMMRIY